MSNFDGRHNIAQNYPGVSIISATVLYVNILIILFPLVVRVEVYVICLGISETVGVLHTVTGLIYVGFHKIFNVKKEDTNITDCFTHFMEVLVRLF